MSRRIYLLALLMAALGVGAAAAQTGSAQKEKEKAEKNKEKVKEKMKAEGRAFSAPPEAFAFDLFMGERSYLGVFLEEVTPERVKDLNLSEERGAVVMKVIENSPAEKAGMKENDVIISFNNRRVDTVRELQRLLSETPAGRTVTFEVLRGGAQQTLTVTLTRRTAETRFYAPDMRLNEELLRNNERLLGRLEEQKRRAEGAKRMEEELAKKQREFGNFNFVFPGFGFRGTRLGITAEPLTAQLAEYFGVKSGRGVLVTEVQNDLPAAKAGLKAGDVITAVDGKPVNDVNDLVAAFTEKEGPVSLTIIRSRAEQSVTVNVEKRETRAPARRGTNL